MNGNAQIVLSDGNTFENEFDENLYSIISRNKPYTSKFNDISMSELFRICFEPICKYCVEYKEWLIFDETHWKRDTESMLIRQYMKKFILLLQMYCDNEIEDNDGDDETLTIINRYRAFVNKYAQTKYRESLIKDCRDEMSISISEFDSKPNLINCENGTYDLDSGVLRDHCAEDYLTMITKCSFPRKFQKIDFPRWDEFIDEITCGNKEVAAYLQRTLGYSLFGVAKEECMFIAYGKTTRNGKGTLFNTIHELLGDYAGTISVNFICQGANKGDNYEKASPMLASLRGTRFVTMSESKDSGKLDEEIIKNYTGNDPIRARNLYEKAFTFTPQFKMWLSCNTLPIVTDKSLYTSERLKVITFDRHFDKDSQDKTLKRQFLEDEAKAYIFRWLVEGYKEYKRIGLAEPKCIQENNLSYEKENDLVANFLEDRCTPDDNGKVYRLDLYTAYKSWCKTNGLPLISSHKFYKEMELKSQLSKIRGTYYFKGITLNSPGGIKIK